MNTRTVARRLEKGQILYRAEFTEGDTLFYYSNRRKRWSERKPRSLRIVTREAATRIAVHWREERKILTQRNGYLWAAQVLLPGDSHEDNPQGGWKD